MRFLGFSVVGLLIIFSSFAYAQWVPSGLQGSNLHINSIAVSWETIVAGTDSGIYRSTDNGTTWTAETLGIGKRWIYSVAVNTTDSGTYLFAGTDIRLESYPFNVDGNTIFRSSDFGISWTCVFSFGEAGRWACLGLIPLNNDTGNIIFSIINYPLIKMFRSTDNGAYWSFAENGIPALTYVASLVVSGTNIFAGTTNGIYLSTDNGAVWDSVNSGISSNTAVWSLAVSGDNIVAGTDSGVFRSTDNGIN